jgi:hypothetical protein
MAPPSTLQHPPRKPRGDRVTTTASAPAPITTLVGTPVPLSPLTGQELRERRDDALLMCGYRCVVATGYGFKAHDLSRLAQLGREANQYVAALEARRGRS